MYDFYSDKILVGGIPISRLTRSELASQMVADCRAAKSGKLGVPKVVISANGSVVAAYHSDQKFSFHVDQADIVDADGMPLVFASKMLCKAPLRERVATTDFIEDAGRAAAENAIRFYFLGGRPGIAADAAGKLTARYPGLQVVGCRHGYFSREDEASLCDEIVASGAQVLWLGLGSPIQERFAIEHRDRLRGLAWIRTCGGLFDHIAERVARAPAWMQSSGLEWLHRAVMEPRRLGWRYISTNPVAAYHLLTKTSDMVGHATEQVPENQSSLA
ncbi:WecB/TagA/CpsF family glycosyltransferase [Methylobacterium tarhaniae]|uniref:WecB/TagA/CpsF family glycosyltransferase n=1 Tax=Methylobacterium tarhaniae TaxID=1187852 RepID=UPI003CFC627F